MRRSTWLGVTVVLSIAGMSSQCRAQISSNGISTDPFSLYYGFFLPRQAALAAQPGPEASINAAVAARQSYAETTRGGLYDPRADFEEADPDMAGDRKRGLDKTPRFTQSRTFPALAPNTGSGPLSYYNRGLGTYYPAIRKGYGLPNQNLAQTKAPNRNTLGRPSSTPNLTGGYNLNPR